ncbi:unnamed protein product [Tetraodon nigroviridis]|uniref:(spotted green pufferfish) hypothetical protein n=1 Tax=Tetraodon nigroviridis TaxID=99883 RepID=Q4TB06_TETNG|nr:unnamed protein product [Tetraodon nigroviridis]
MLWDVGLVLLFLLAPHAAVVKDAPLRTAALSRTEDASSGHLASLEGSGLELAPQRSRRSVFLHSGIRICPRESVSEVLANHQAYYQLRVCQEAVWEAFRIFFDRIPGTSEYQMWVHACQQESLCISDLARNFSSSEEHVSLVQKVRTFLYLCHAAQGALTACRGPPQRWTPLLAPLAAPQDLLRPWPPAPPVPHLSSLLFVLEDTELPNVVPESPQEQTVAFGIDLVDPGYRELLDDPDSPQYVDLAHHLQEQMQHAFDRLAGFRSLRVLGIRMVCSKAALLRRPAGISVQYSLTFEVNALKSSAAAASELPEASVASRLKQMVTKALQEEASLPIDLDTLRFDPDESLGASLWTWSLTRRLFRLQPSEPDSHNDLRVAGAEPLPDQPRPGAALTPQEKENDLVTLLGPTASVGKEEEETLIITHQVETIRQEGTGQLVKDSGPAGTPPDPDDPGSEDPAPEDSWTSSVTPATHLLTTAPAADQLVDGPQATTSASLTGQPPTRTTAELLGAEDDGANRLPEGAAGHLPASIAETEAHHLAEPDTKVELLEPEGHSEFGPEEELLEVLRPEETEFFVPEEDDKEAELQISEEYEEGADLSEPEQEVSPREPVEEPSEISEPEEEVLDLAEEASKPVEVSEPVEELLEPVEEPSEVSERVEVSEPVEEASEPVEEPSEVSELKEKVENRKPGEELLEPVGEDSEPVEEALEPLEEASEPLEELLEPIEELLEPVEELSEPVEKVSEPVEEVSEPIEELLEPVEEVSEPVEKASEPVEEVSEPIEELLEPVEEVSEPIEEDSEPVELLEPVDEDSEPVEELLEPVEEASEPVELLEPVEELLEPVEEASEPVEELLEPVEEALEPVEELLEPVRRTFRTC